MLADLSTALVDAAEWIWRPIGETSWTDLRSFWLQRVFDDRYLVCYFLPLLPILLLFRRRHLRTGIVLTGLAFMTYVYGALYPLFWLAMCLVFWRLAERYAIETKRTDVIRWGPPLAAGGIIVGWFLITQGLQWLKVPALTDWLFEHARWVFPLGARSLADRPFLWEPVFAQMFPFIPPDRPPPLANALFYNPHNIGTAYFTVRMWQYFCEIRRDNLPRERRTLGHFLAFTCYAPTMMQGPIEPYAAFQDEMDTCHERRSWRNLPPAAGRIGWGVAKSLIAQWYFAPILWHDLGIGQPLPRYYDAPREIGSYALLYFGAHLQIFTLYLEFSGYCDVAAGIARVLGYRQIENFNWPWLATSLRDFWRRWHISLSQILRDYLYIPLGGNRRHVTLNLSLTFIIVGLWHAPLFKFIAWGALMGVMLAINQSWAQWMRRLDQRSSGALPALRRGVLRLRPLPTLLAWAFTMHCFAHSLLIFFGGSGAIRVYAELIRRPLQALLGE
jgi:D-alanyl-lipoteichoic acid acyltransferase DltB (MBOAT superfamily)